MEIIGALIASLIAGLSTLLGVVITYVKPKNYQRFITINLAFAMGVMALISIKELIPISVKEIYRMYKLSNACLIWLICPLFCLILLGLTESKTKNNNSLKRVGVLSAIMLFIHNIPEGIATFISTLANSNIGIKITLAIMAHNIPEGIAIAVPIYYATKRRSQAIKYTLISGMAEPVGGLLCYLLFKPYLNEKLLCVILYFVGTLMLIMACLEILPEVMKAKRLDWLMIGIILSLAILIV